MRSNRTFLQEAKALDYLIENIYLAQKEICEDIEKEDINANSKQILMNRAKLNIINYFIEIYERF